MKIKEFRKKDLVDLLCVINELTISKTEDDLKKTLISLQDTVGGDYLIFGIGQSRGFELVGTPKIINVSYPWDWLGVYAEKQLYYTDPIVAHNFKYQGTQLWKDTYRLFNSKETKKFVSSAEDFGLYHGVSGGTSNGELTSILTFAGKEQSWFTKYQKNILSIVSPHLHEAMVRLNYNPEAITPKKRLSDRESEILQWAKEGKTNWEISVILGLSQRAVKFHMQKIERKLNARNKSHAIAVALLEKLIEL